MLVALPKEPRNMNINTQVAPSHKKMGKKLKCEQCPYIASDKWKLTAHVEVVHDKIKRYHCEDCGNDFARKDGLERHWDAVHNTGDKKYKCGICPYSNAQNSKLKTHMERKHKMTVTSDVKGEDDL